MKKKLTNRKTFWYSCNTKLHYLVCSKRIVGSVYMEEENRFKFEFELGRDRDCFAPLNVGIAKTLEVTKRKVEEELKKFFLEEGENKWTVEYSFKRCCDLKFIEQLYPSPIKSPNNLASLFLVFPKIGTS